MKYLLITSESCVPCKNVKRAISEKYTSKIEIEEVDIYDNPTLSRKYSLRSAPTLLGIDGDILIEKHIGEGKILEFLSKL
jgi:glutaredoxin